MTTKHKESVQTELKHILELEYALNFSGTALLSACTFLKSRVSQKDYKEIDTAIKAYCILVNSANGFLQDYAKHLKGGTWPAVPIKPPPPIKPGASTLQDVISSIESAVSLAILNFEGTKHGGEAATALSELEKALIKIAKLINKSDSDALNQTVGL